MRRVILIFIVLIFVLWLPHYAGAANGSLYLSPTSGIYTVGSTFSITARVNTDGIAINAAQGTLSFPPDKLEIVSISKSGSIFSLWPNEPTYSNFSGAIVFGGGVPNPGYTGASGKILAITFKARASGTASVNWSSGAVLANDGKGTNILATLGNGNYTLSAEIITPAPEPLPPGVPAMPVVSSPTHPDENKWYPFSTVQFSWSLPKDVSDVSILFNQKPSSNPGSISDGLFSSKTYENVADGVWYFHIKFKNKNGWGEIKHFKVQIDTTPPEPFIIRGEEETDNPRPILLFESKDDVSGIDYYEIKIGEGDFFQWIGEVESNPFEMPPQLPGKRTLIVKAVDKAGNNTAATKDITIKPIESPVITHYPTKITVGDALEIKGRALPNSTVRLFIAKEEGELFKKEIDSDSEGNWSYIHEKVLRKGIYSIWAESIDQRGAVSYPCEKIIVSVGPPLFIKIGKLIIDYFTVVIILLGIIVLAIFGSYWVWHRFRRFRKRLSKETEDVTRVLRRAFNLLKEEIGEQLAKLEKVKSKRELNEEERSIEKELKKDLDQAEKYIKKEVKDLEEELK